MDSLGERSVKSDIIIIGGGIVGSSIAYHLSQLPGAGKVLVLERDATYTRAATPLANGGIRRLFSLPENIQMADFGLSFYQDFAQHMKVGEQNADIGFRRQGYLFISDNGGCPADGRELPTAGVDGCPSGASESNSARRAFSVAEAERYRSCGAVGS